MHNKSEVRVYRKSRLSDELQLNFSSSLPGYYCFLKKKNPVDSPINVTSNPKAVREENLFALVLWV